MIDFLKFNLKKGVAWLLTSSSPYHVDYLLALRGILALSVVIHHYQYRTYLNKKFDTDVFSYLAPNGAEAVYLFFILSGYLMAKILHEKYNYKSGTLHFYINRLTRIVPVYYLAVLMTFPAASVVERYWASTTDVNNILHTVFFLGNYGNLVSNPPLWSLSTEMQFYLIAPLLPIIFATRKTTHLVIIYVLILILSFLIRLPYHNAERAVYYYYSGLEVNLIFFLSGWFAYRLKNDLPKFNPWHAFVGILFMLILSWVVYVEFVPNNLHGMVKSHIWYFITPAVFAIVSLVLLPSLDAAISISENPGLFTRIIISILSFLGVTSFSVYVIHMIFPRFLMKTAPEILSLGVPITIKVYVFCILVYLFIERPFYSLRIKQSNLAKI